MLPGDGGSYATGLNDNADVVGISIGPGGDRPFRWNAVDGIVPLATLGGAGSSIASDINNSGAIVGTSRLPNGQSHAVLWHPDGAITDLGTLGGSTSSASAINEAGQVVGTSDMPGDSVAHGFLWDPVNGMMDISALSIAPHPRWLQGLEEGHQASHVGTGRVAQRLHRLGLGGRGRQRQAVDPVPSGPLRPVDVHRERPLLDRQLGVRLSRRGLRREVRHRDVHSLGDDRTDPDGQVCEHQLVVELSNPSGGLTLGTATGVGTILDDDPGSGLRAGIGDVSVAEGTSGLGNAVKVAVTLSSPAPGPTTLLVTFADVTTTNGVDYKTVKATKLLTFQAGQRQKQVSLKLYPDARVEPDETVSISLSNPSAGLTLDRANGTITILDDD
jgi:probable HAF family extracellular repeat protein